MRQLKDRIRENLDVPVGVKVELKYALLSFFFVVVGRAALRGRSLCHGSNLAQTAEQGKAGRRAYALISLT